MTATVTDEVGGTTAATFFFQDKARTWRKVASPTKSGVLRSAPPRAPVLRLPSSTPFPRVRIKSSERVADHPVLHWRR